MPNAVIKLPVFSGSAIHKVNESDLTYLSPAYDSTAKAFWNFLEGTLKTKSGVSSNLITQQDLSSPVFDSNGLVVSGVLAKSTNTDIFDDTLSNFTVATVVKFQDVAPTSGTQFFLWALPTSSKGVAMYNITEYGNIIVRYAINGIQSANLVTYTPAEIIGKQWFMSYSVNRTTGIVSVYLKELNGDKREFSLNKKVVYVNNNQAITMGVNSYTGPYLPTAQNHHQMSLAVYDEYYNDQQLKAICNAHVRVLKLTV